MFDQANSFYVCAKLCERELDEHPTRHDMYSTPQIVNLAFACEVYLKSLLNFYKIDFGKSHKLNELLNMLPDEVRNSIENRTFDKRPVLFDAFGYKLIDKIADAFVEWRYSYEVSRLSCEIGYLNALADSIKEECCMRLFNTNWEAYCMTVKINSDL